MSGGGGFLKKTIPTVNRTFQPLRTSRRYPDPSRKPPKQHRRANPKAAPASFQTIRLKRGDYPKPDRNARPSSPTSPRKSSSNKPPPNPRWPVSERGGDIRSLHRHRKAFRHIPMKIRPKAYNSRPRPGRTHDRRSFPVMNSLQAPPNVRPAQASAVKIGEAYHSSTPRSARYADKETRLSRRKGAEVSKTYEKWRTREDSNL